MSFRALQATLVLFSCLLLIVLTHGGYICAQQSKVDEADGTQQESEETSPSSAAGSASHVKELPRVKMELPEAGRTNADAAKAQARSDFMGILFDR